MAGGGALLDVGLYCLNTTRFPTGKEPTEVFANIFSTPGDPRLREVEEMVTWQMRFPSGIYSNNATIYGFHEDCRYRVHAATAWFGRDPAYSYSGLQPQVSYAQGKIEHRETPRLGKKNQFALEMDHMAQCVMEVIYESAHANKPVKLPHFDRPLFLSYIFD